MTLKVAVIGAGGFGKALAKVASDAGYTVSLWNRGDDLQDALKKPDLVISALPIQAIRDVWKDAAKHLPPSCLILNAAKGIDADTHVLSEEIFKGVLPDGSLSQLAHLSGPSFAEEILQSLPVMVTVASRDLAVSQQIQSWIQSKTFQISTTTDVTGVLLGGALKNVVAIAAGMVEGLSLGESARAGIVTQGFLEMVKLATAMRAHPETLMGLSGFGDLILTCAGKLSRNRRFGFALASGKSLKQCLEEMGSTVEGVNSAKSIPHLCFLHRVNMPICLAVHQVLFEGANPRILIN